MGTYHQLTEYQRYQICALKKAGHTQHCIAATLEVSPSMICRELWRNRGRRGYRPSQAHQQALARRRHKAKATKMTAAVIERIEAERPRKGLAFQTPHEIFMQGNRSAT